MKETSLGDFVDDGDEAAKSIAPATDTDEPPAADTAAGRPQPPTSTYRWAPDGGTCAACGRMADHRWHDDAGLVCPDCKDW